LLQPFSRELDIAYVQRDWLLLSVHQNTQSIGAMGRSYDYASLHSDPAGARFTHGGEANPRANDQAVCFAVELSTRSGRNRRPAMS